MKSQTDSTVDVETSVAPLTEGVRAIADIMPELTAGCRAFVHFNGPTELLSGMSAGMAVLDPGASPHPPHQHPEEEFLIVAAGTGEIYCKGVTTPVGPGAVMYCNGNTLHGIMNTGPVPMIFYWSKWLAKKA
jgi:mannose-6-phosphate isomerase-like protein (cupin superfamily)